MSAITEGYIAVLRILVTHSSGAEEAARQARQVEAEAKAAAEILEALVRFERNHTEQSQD